MEEFRPVSGNVVVILHVIVVNVDAERNHDTRQIRRGIVEILIVRLRNRNVAVNLAQNFPLHTLELVRVDAIGQLLERVVLIVREPLPNQMLDIMQTQENFRLRKLAKQRDIRRHVDGFNMDNVKILVFEHFRQLGNHIFVIKPANLIGISGK